MDIVLAEIGVRSERLAAVQRFLEQAGYQVRPLDEEEGSAGGQAAAMPALCVALDSASRPLDEAVAWLRGLRARRAAAELLALTDRAAPEEPSALLDAGADDLAAWPAEAALLAARIRRILERARERAELLRRCAELEATDDALARSSERYRALLAGVPDVILRLDRDGRCLDAHARSLPELDRYLVGRPASGFLPPETTEHARAARLAALETGAVQMVELAVNAQGQRRVLEARLVPVSGEEVIVVARDVTERRQMEQQLRIAERMASLGTLAAGVAHEINNPLAFTLLYLEMAEGELRQALACPPAPGGIVRLFRATRKAAEAVEHALTGVSRVQRIVKDLREFSRIDDDETVPVDVLRALEVSLEMSAATLRPRARVVRDLAPVPRILGSAVRLEQVFLNLLTNAAQAIPEGSTEQHEIRVSSRLTGDGLVAVEIRDTGQGIAPEALPRVFDPFFTTKPVGLGTGLGLAICHRLVTGLGGAIKIDSTPGRGTVVRVLLPPAEPAADAPVAVAAAPAAAPSSPSRPPAPSRKERLSAHPRG